MLPERAKTLRGEPHGESVARVVPLFRGRDASDVNPLHVWADPGRVDKRELCRLVGDYLGRSGAVSTRWVNRAMARPEDPLPYRKMGATMQSSVVFNWPRVKAWLDARSYTVE